MKKTHIFGLFSAKWGHRDLQYSLISWWESHKRFDTPHAHKLDFWPFIKGGKNVQPTISMAVSTLENCSKKKLLIFVNYHRIHMFFLFKKKKNVTPPWSIYIEPLFFKQLLANTFSIFVSGFLNKLEFYKYRQYM